MSARHIQGRLAPLAKALEDMLPEAWTVTRTAYDFTLAEVARIEQEMAALQVELDKAIADRDALADLLERGGQMEKSTGPSGRKDLLKKDRATVVDDLPPASRAAWDAFLPLYNAQIAMQEAQREERETAAAAVDAARQQLERAMAEDRLEGYAIYDLIRLYADRCPSGGHYY